MRYWLTVLKIRKILRLRSYISVGNVDARQCKRKNSMLLKQVLITLTGDKDKCIFYNNAVTEGSMSLESVCIFDKHGIF